MLHCWQSDFQTLNKGRFGLTEALNRWEKRLLDSKRLLSLTDELLKPLEDQRGETVVAQGMMICKLVWTAYDDEISSLKDMNSQ